MSAPAALPAQVDVVVVGAGLAGVVAALTAAEAGAEVLLVEKAAEMGGSSVRAGGGLLFAGTALQEQLDIDDDGEKLRAAILAYGRGASDPETVDVYIRHQLDTYDWMVGQGVEFALFPTGTSEVSRMHSTPQGYLARHLHQRFLEREGTRYVTDTRALRLTTADSRVNGVVLDSGAGEVTVGARRAVVLASGGFARSEELLAKFAPAWVDAVKMSGTENTGDGLLMAWAVGAGLADMGYIEPSFGASINRFPELGSQPGDEPRLLYPNSQGAIIVNKEGRRFVDENLNYKIISGVVANEPDRMGFQVFDDKIMGRSRPSPSPADWRSGFEQGLVLRADTVAGLAELMQVDPAALEKTVDTYNSYVDAGTDPDFGRKIHEYGGGPGHARIDTAPYYAFPCRNGLTTTYCGLTVNGRLQVLDVFGAPVAGLFAAGEVVGGFHGATYLSGTGLGKAAVFGRAAGLESVAD